MENVEFLLLWKENGNSGNGLFFLSWKVMNFYFFSVSCPWKFPRISPGQVQNYQLLGGLLVSVKSIEKVTSTQEQVQKYCNWRKEALFRL